MWVAVKTNNLTSQNFKRWILLIAIAFLTFFNGLNVSAQNQLADGYALFLYNFAKYSEWPVETEKFTFVVYGSEGVTSSLKTIALNKKINGKAIAAKDYTSASDLENAQIIFVGKDNSDKLNLILSRTKGKPVMVITEKADLINKGASISFLLDKQSRLKFSLNDRALEKRKLKMAQSLKSMAFKS